MARYQRIKNYHDFQRILADGEDHTFLQKKDGEDDAIYIIYQDMEDNGETIYMVATPEDPTFSDAYSEGTCMSIANRGILYVQLDADDDSEGGGDTFVDKDQPIQSKWWLPEDVPTGDYVIPDGVTHIAPSALSGYCDLKSVTMPDSVIEVGRGALGGCPYLTSVVLSKNLVTIPELMFVDDVRLTSVHLPKGILSIEPAAFYGCRNMERINIPGSLERIGDQAFDGCAGLTSLRLPQSVQWIGEKAFSGCCNLSITLPERFRGANSSQLGLISCKKVRLE